MTDAGFVGEVRQQPKRQGAARVAGGIGLVLAVIGFLAVAGGGLVLGSIATPFHYYDAMTVVGVAVGPAVLVLAGTKLLAPGAGGPMKRLDVLCGLFVFFVMIPGNYLLYLNERLDHSSAATEIVRVRDVWILTNRHGNESFMANVEAGVKSPLGRWSFYSAQPVRLGAAEWRSLIPGQSMLDLRIHPGRFGFAWYEANPQVILR